MANFMYTPEKERLMEGAANYLEAGDNIRVILVMTDSTADTDQDATNLSGAGDITTLDEFNTNHLSFLFSTNFAANQAGNHKNHYQRYNNRDDNNAGFFHANILSADHATFFL